MQMKTYMLAGAAIFCAATSIPLNAFEQTSAVPALAGAAFFEETCSAFCHHSSHGKNGWFGPSRKGDHDHAFNEAMKDAKVHNDANSGHEALANCDIGS
jgi:hypothetical protein